MKMIMPAEKVIHIAVAISVFFALKLVFDQAELSSVMFLLTPTNFLIEMMTNSVGQLDPIEGFYHAGLNIYIGSTCAGLTFWTLCYLMLAGLTIYHTKTSYKSLFIIPGSLILAYLLTIFVNASRILFAIIGQAFGDLFLPARPHLLLHNLIGNFVYLFFLVVIYFVVKAIFIKPTKLVKFYERFT